MAVAWAVVGIRDSRGLWLESGASHRKVLVKKYYCKALAGYPLRGIIVDALTVPLRRAERYSSTKGRVYCVALGYETVLDASKNKLPRLQVNIRVILALTGAVGNLPILNTPLHTNATVQ